MARDCDVHLAYVSYAYASVYVWYMYLRNIIQLIRLDFNYNFKLITKQQFY
jgi:hypothetical protein